MITDLRRLSMGIEGCTSVNIHLDNPDSYHEDGFYHYLDGILHHENIYKGGMFKTKQTWYREWKKPEVREWSQHEEAPDSFYYDPEPKTYFGIVFTSFFVITVITLVTQKIIHG